MSYERIGVKRSGRIVTVTIERPEAMNALDFQANLELTRAFDEFAADDESWVAILTGAGDRAFSAGADLKSIHTITDEQRARMRSGEIRFGGITRHFVCDKPIIAAVNGFALGGGFEMALASDIVVAAEHARFGLPEPKVGLVAGAGGIHRLPRQVGLKQAMGMMLTGRQIDAPEAYRLGLVNEVVPAGALMATALHWAEEILACAPLSVRATKRIVRDTIGLPLDEALALDEQNLAEVRASGDNKEGPRAFAEKRKPQWKGR